MKHLCTLLAWAALFSAPMTTQAQYVDLGLPTVPNDHDIVDDLIYYGGFLDFSGGYHVGDTAANFTIYDFDGNPFNFYEELQNDKPVMLISGSVSCLRFRDSFPNEGEQPSQEYLAADIFFDNYADNFNLAFVYGIEAHPTDGNCPSNCPPTFSNDTTVIQAPDYLYRKWAMKTWTDSPNFHFPFPMYCDNPDNALYNTFFQRPFGVLIFNCDATVAYRGDWTNQFLMQNTDAILEFAQAFSTCSINVDPEVDEEEELEGEDDEGTGEEETGDGEDGEGTDEEEDVVSVADIAIASQWGFYPNPANQLLTIKVVQPEAFETFSLIDITGKVIMNGQITQNTTRLDVSEFATGLYFVEMIGQNGKAARERLIIR